MSDYLDNAAIRGHKAMVPTWWWFVALPWLIRETRQGKRAPLTTSVADVVISAGPAL